MPQKRLLNRRKQRQRRAQGSLLSPFSPVLNEAVQIARGLRTICTVAKSAPRPPPRTLTYSVRLATSSTNLNARPAEPIRSTPWRKSAPVTSRCTRTDTAGEPHSRLPWLSLDRARGDQQFSFWPLALTLDPKRSTNMLELFCCLRGRSGRQAQGFTGALQLGPECQIVCIQRAQLWGGWG
jgi:hypothetical protein